MLQLRPNCECCDRDLPNESPDARICTFECTFCSRCAEERLANVCPNCAGELVRRPIRPAAALARNPASVERIYQPHGCTDGSHEADGARVTATRASEFTPSRSTGS